MYNREAKNTSYYLQKINPNILNSFNPQQLDAVNSIIEELLPKPSPKIVDLRFVVDLIITRFYVVILVGKERRQTQRQYFPRKFSKFGNIIMASMILIALNLLITCGIFIFIYLIKSSLGIDFFPGHITENMEKLDIN